MATPSSLYERTTTRRWYDRLQGFVLILSLLLFLFVCLGLVVLIGYKVAG